MSRRALVGLVCLAAGLSPAASRGVVVVEVRDVHDDPKVVRRVADDPGVVASRREVEALRRRLLRWKGRDFLAAFGAALDPDKVDGALPAAETRVLGVPFHDPNPDTNKQHRDAFAVGEVGRLVVWFGHDGESPQYVLFYLETDADFPKLDRVETLPRRLAWERPRFARLAGEVDRLWRKAVVWEVDPGAEKARSRGLESADFAVKLDAAKRWGREQGYTLRYEVSEEDRTPSWTWLRGDVVTASADGAVENGKALATRYQFYRADGSLLRDENPDMIRWYRRDGETVARIELGRDHGGAWRPYEWSWYDARGRIVRQEADDNGDGLPDVQGDNNIVDQEHYHPVTLDRSWAVHPDLIPADLREPGLPERRVPVRKIPEPVAGAPTPRR